MDQAKDNKKAYALKAAAALLVVLALILCGWAVSSTLAKYATQVGGTSTAPVAKFDVSAGSLNAKGDAVIDLFSTTKTFKEDGTTLNTAVVQGKIAPGTGGKFDIELTNNSEVAVDYELTCDLTKNGLPLELSADNTTWSETYTPITGDIASAEGGVAKTVTKTIYWRWAYERTAGSGADANNEADTNAGESTSVNPVAKVSVQFTQKQG